MQAKMGRPPKAPEDRAGPAVQFRIRGEVKAEIERQALLAGRSISEECEFRLTRSIQREAAAAEVFGSSARQSLLIALGNVVRLADAMSDGPENATAQVNAAVIHLVEELAGKKAAAVLDEASESGHEWQTAAKRVAQLEKHLLMPQTPLPEIMGR